MLTINLCNVKSAQTGGQYLLSVIITYSARQRANIRHTHIAVMGVVCKGNIESICYASKRRNTALHEHSKEIQHVRMYELCHPLDNEPD